MRAIKIVTVGKIKQSAGYLIPGIELYQKRLARQWSIEWIELSETAPTPTRTLRQVLDKEAEQFLKYLAWADRSVLLSERGRLLHSEDFAAWLYGNPLNGGPPQDAPARMMFIIGGAYGTAKQLEDRVSDVISLSPLTFPHQMVRLLLLEQLYRAQTIALNEPYHK